MALISRFYKCNIFVIELNYFFLITLNRTFMLLLGAYRKLKRKTKEFIFVKRRSTGAGGTINHTSEIQRGTIGPSRMNADRYGHSHCR